MLARVALATLLLLTPSFAVQVKKVGKGGNYAYVSIWMNKNHTPASLNDDVQEEEAEYSKNDVAKERRLQENALEEALDPPTDGAWRMGRQGKLKARTQEQALIPPGGSKMYGPAMIFKIDKQLRESGAKYPYVVITNDPKLIHSEELKDHPDMKLIQVGSDVSFLNLGGKIKLRNKNHVQKLSVFNMTQYDKILSLDMDIIVKKNVDHIFTDFDTKDGKKVWGMYNDFTCAGGRGLDRDDWFNSGVMLLEPKKGMFEEIMEYVSTRGGFWGDQRIIQNYFQKKGEEESKKKNERLGLFPLEVADFVDCKERMGKKKPDIVHLR